MEAPRIVNRSTCDLLLHRKGDPVSLSVEVKGSPSPQVTWFLGERPLETSLEYITRVHGRVYNLYISRVNAEVNDGLTVEAKNEAGVDRLNLNLKVYTGKHTLSHSNALGCCCLVV